MNNQNRLHNSTNPNQGEFKRVLCVCSAGLLRSPTAAVVLSQNPFNFNTRAVGLFKDYSLIVLDAVLLRWAQEIVCMTFAQKEDLRRLTKKPIVCLDIPDSYAYRDPNLVTMIKTNYSKQVKDDK